MSQYKYSQNERVYKNRSSAVYRSDERRSRSESRTRYSKYFKYENNSMNENDDYRRYESNSKRSKNLSEIKPINEVAQTSKSTSKPTLLDIQYKTSERSLQYQQQVKPDEINILKDIHQHKNLAVKEVHKQPIIQAVYIKEGKLQSKMQIGLESFLEQLVNRLAKSDMIFDFDNQNIYSLIVPGVSTLYFNSFDNLVNCVNYFKDLIGYEFSSYITHYIGIIYSYKKFYAEQSQTKTQP